MQPIVDFFQNLFSPIVNVLGAVLLYLHGYGLPWWLSIVVLTVIVRALLFPLTVKQVKSMRAMQELKPEMDKVRAKYTNNRQKQQEEMMKLYQERGVNPLGGCLPILVQMPIFIGIFYVIREFGGAFGTEPSQPTFTTGGILWFKDLSAADPYFLLPIISAVTMLLSMEITNKNIDPQQRWLMRILPIGITFFLLRFPAGLFVYWITSNLVTLVQNYAIYNFGPGRKPSKSEGGRSGNGAGPSGNGQGRQDDVEEASQSARAAKRKRRRKKR
jgi:YidC/Oxa1 family membrane protein insertase